jgi:hypothetical protein
MANFSRHTERALTGAYRPSRKQELPGAIGSLVERT